MGSIAAAFLSATLILMSGAAWSLGSFGDFDRPASLHRSATSQSGADIGLMSRPSQFMSGPLA